MAAVLWLPATTAQAERPGAERLLAFVPQPASATPQPMTEEHQRGLFPAVGLPGNTADQRQWLAYHEAWLAHHRDPADPAIRRRLRLPDQAAIQVEVTDGQAAARSLQRAVAIPWRQPLLLETEHFWVVADLPHDQATQLAEELERFFAVWTQWYFPLWSQRRSWDGGTSGGAGRRPPQRRQAGPPADKHRVVALGDRQQYLAALRSEAAPVEQSVGYYAAPQRITFLLAAPSADDPSANDPVAAAVDARATLYHELTHQLLAEATDSRLRTLPGQRSGFWLAEGIACFMESLHIDSSIATVGGWEASRLQFARQYVLGSSGEVALPALRLLGQAAFQRQANLSVLYALAAADVHATVDRQPAGGRAGSDDANADPGDGWQTVLEQLADLYAVRSVGGGRATFDLPNDLVGFLKLDDQRLTPIVRDDLLNLCLARCDVTAEGLKRIPPQHQLRWLDLTGLSLQTTDVVRLAPNVSGLAQLSLEATSVNESLADWIGGAPRLRELDLSWTRVGDRTLKAVSPAAPLETLWLTGTQVSDASLERIAGWQSLRQVDLQRTPVTDEGLQRLKTLRPDLVVNPLQLLRQP